MERRGENSYGSFGESPGRGPRSRRTLSQSRRNEIWALPRLALIRNSQSDCFFFFSTATYQYETFPKSTTISSKISSCRWRRLRSCRPWSWWEGLFVSNFGILCFTSLPAKHNFLLCHCLVRCFYSEQIELNGTEPKCPKISEFSCVQFNLVLLLCTLIPPFWGWERTSNLSKARETRDGLSNSCS